MSVSALGVGALLAFEEVADEASLEAIGEVYDPLGEFS